MRTDGRTGWRGLHFSLDFGSTDFGQGLKLGVQIIKEPKVVVQSQRGAGAQRASTGALALVVIKCTDVNHCKEDREDKESRMSKEESA